jgi:photosystem II stability/assembly factor-like uncharacterized protein
MRNAFTGNANKRNDMLYKTLIRHGLSLMLALMLGMLALPPARAASAITLVHVHGLSYSADGWQLLIPSHDGLAVYSDGQWSKAPGPKHDYMGFSATRDALYSSGHPAPGAQAINPFGLIKSRDGGKTWSKLGLEGESDFHSLATSYSTNAVYVVNHQPNSRMKQAGIYFTLNDGLQWQHAAAHGIGAEVNSLAVHPSDAKVVAVGTDDGLFLSRDAANNFQRLAGGGQVLATSFDLDGEHLWFSTFAAKPALLCIGLQPGAKAEELALPPLAKDAVAYIVQNPLHHDEIAIATFKRSVYLSKDQGKTWKQLANEGATL